MKAKDRCADIDSLHSDHEVRTSVLPGERESSIHIYFAGLL